MTHFSVVKTSLPSFDTLTGSANGEALALAMAASSAALSEAMTSVNVRSTLPAAFDARIVSTNVPFAVGVPDSVPVLASNFKPAGSVPTVCASDGAGTPVTSIVAE